MKLVRLPLIGAALLAPVICLLPPALRAQTTSVAPRVTERVDPEKLTTLRGNTHPMARPEFDRGAAPDNLPIPRMLLVLQRAPEQERALRQLLDEQQTKSSPNFHKWLTPDEFGTQFGPTDADIQATTDWLIAQGFQVNQITHGRTMIEFSGTAGQVRQALHTEIHQYAVNGAERWANSSDPQIPAALAPIVRGIVSLNNFPRQTLSRTLGTFSRSKETGEVRPLFTYNDPNFGPTYAVGPGDFAKIYNVQPLWDAGIDGTGFTIAIVGASNINIQDVRDFRSMFGLPAKDPVIVLNGPDPGVSYSESEADLDVQWAGAVAKSATIKLVVSADTETAFGADLSALYIVDNNLAPVMSDSFGNCEAQLGSGGNAFYNALWEQAAAQGITVMVATGDSGSAGCDNPNFENAAQFGLGVGGLASTPFNVAVGGTDFDDLANPSTYWNTASGTVNSAKSYIPELPWNDSCANTGLTTGCTSVSTFGLDLVAGGGGTSTIYAQPSWQTGTGTNVPNDGKRHIPDVSLFSGDGLNGNFLVYCQADANTGAGSTTTSCNLSSPFTNFKGAGGTSFAAPAFAGIMALVNQKTGARQGNANYVLYPLAAKPGNICVSSSPTTTCIFHDITTSNISVACEGGSQNCSKTTAGGTGVIVDPSNPAAPAWPSTASYDMATGLGSVNAANLVNNWASINFKPSTTTLVSISPTAINHGQPVNVNITVTGAGTPTGDVSLANSSNVALGIPSFNLTGGTFSGSTTFLPGGTYSVTAHYAGDGSFAASDSAPPGIQVTVSPEPSKTQLGLVTFDWNTGIVTSTRATTAAYGSPYVLRGDVTNNSGTVCTSLSSGQLVYPCPTGTVTITDNGAQLDAGAFGLNSQGFTEDIPIQLLPGSHNLLAGYGGDSSFGTSSTTDAITITQATTTLALSSASSGTGGSILTLTANLSTQSNGDAPTGTVQFFSGGTLLSGAVTYVRTAYSTLTAAPAALQATLTTTPSAVGTGTITAQFGNDPNYANSTATLPAGFNFTADSASVNVPSVGKSATATFTVSSISGFTGSVSFSCSVPTAMKESTCSVSPASVTTSGSTTLTVTTTAPHTVGSVLELPTKWLPFGGGLVVLGLLMLSLPPKWRRMKLAMGVACICLVAGIAVGCGGGSSSGGGSTTDPGTPAGTYSVTVTAASGSITQTANVSVIVP